ncbi:LPXTG cell wall anchor domain-containing protein [Helicobacter pylori]
MTLQKTNKQVIDELINQAKTKDLDSYNETSSQNYYTNIDAIKNDYTNSTYSRDDVEDVKNRINSATSNLKTLKSDLLDIINTKSAQDFSAFSKDSKDLYLAKINELKTYFEDASTTINKDNFALEKQKIDALNNLLKSNKEMLLDKLNTLKSNPFNEYSDDDKATINQKIDALLQEINAKPAVTNSEYDDYLNKINQISAGLVSYKDKMLAKIDDAKNSLTRNKYVTTSLEKFDNDIANLKNKVTSSEAKDYNKNVYDADEITLNNILNSLLTYTDNLLTNVKDEISQKFDAKKSNYTDASKAKFNEAFDKIMKEIADKKANGDLIDKDQHDKYQKDLENLFNDLEKVKSKNKMPA